MNTTVGPDPKTNQGNPQSGGSDLELFFASVQKAINSIFNWLFSPSHEAASNRRLMVVILFLLAWLVFVVYSRPMEENQALVNQLGWALASGNPFDFIPVFFNLLGIWPINPIVLRHILALYVPFWLMHWMAAIYLGDVFEINGKTSHRFVSQAAFAARYSVIHIQQGMVTPEDAESPMLQIGGPGHVVVELDSAAVFENPDGTCFVVGPTNQEWHGSHYIEGFVRLRQGVDLRDILARQNISTRSRDGIPISANDVQYSYSVYRGRKPVKNSRMPYPFDEAAVINMVYDSIRPVREGEKLNAISDWNEALPGKISASITRELTSFFNKRGLSDFLVTIGQPEEESLEEREKELDERFRTITTKVSPPSEGLQPENSALHKTGRLPRQSAGPGADARSILLTLLQESFRESAPRRGTQLNWIGAGTWNTPASIIPRNHREAWKISRDNLSRGNSEELEHIRQEANLAQQTQLVEDSILRVVFQNGVELKKEEKQLAASLLAEYLNILERARDLYIPNVPEDLLKAISSVQHQLFTTPYHSLGDYEVP